MSATSSRSNRGQASIHPLARSPRPGYLRAPAEVDSATGDPAPDPRPTPLPQGHNQAMAGAAESRARTERVT